MSKLLEYKNRIIASRDEEIQDLCEQLEKITSAGHELMDDLAAVRAENRALKRQLESMEKK